LFADLKFQSVSELCKNFTRNYLSEFEVLIYLIGGKNLEKGHSFQQSYFLFKKVWHWRYFSWRVVIRTLACSTCSKFPSKRAIIGLKRVFIKQIADFHSSDCFSP
jgi:hypothetical protein